MEADAGQTVVMPSESAVEVESRYFTLKMQLRLHFSFIFAASCVLSANLPRAPRTRQPAAGKAFYNIFPKANVDPSETAAFVKAIVGNEDLLPWTDVRENLISWTVEASDNELSRLQAHPGIERVTRLELPPPPAAGVVSARTVTDAPTDNENGAKNLKRQESGKRYYIAPSNGDDKSQCAETEKLIKDLVQHDVVPNIIGDSLILWTLYMTDSQAAEASKIPGVEFVEPDLDLEFDMGEPPVPQPPSVAKQSVAMAKRDLLYSRQKNAVTELVVVSQPDTIPNIADLNDYVYESNNGRGSFVYHVELGVAFAAQAAEFPNVATEHLQTEEAAREGRQPSVDPTDSSHGTCTAGKAVGLKYGVSKQATLVVVQISKAKLSELILGLGLVSQDIRSRPQRRKKAVVTLSISAPPAIPDRGRILLKDATQSLFDLDVPVVVSAGNHGREGGRRNVDTYPASLEGPDFPLIVVGGTNSKGELRDWSQTGPHVTLHAQGEEITCFSKTGDVLGNKWGNSVTTPQVAGEVANLLARHDVPFDTDRNLVKNLKNYLESDQASWERQPGIRVLWNGATKDVHDQAAASRDDESTGNLTCHGLGSNKYVARDHLKYLIEKKFCPEAVSQGSLDKDAASIMREYNKGTMEEVHISMDYRPGLDFKPNQDNCVRNLMNAVDNCDGNNPKKNPENYKGGGRVAHGEITYRIDPQALRSPAEKGRQGGCDSKYKFFWNEYWVWGHGFASDDWGKSLRDQVDDCALLPDTWNFQYGTGDDGREWTAHFRTGVFQKKCVFFATKEAGAPDGFECTGSG